MAEYYETGTTSGVTDLLFKVVDALKRNGYTSHFGRDEGSGHRAHLSKDGLFLNFRSSESYLSGEERKIEEPIPERNHQGNSPLSPPGSIPRYDWEQPKDRYMWVSDWLALNVGDGYNANRQWYNQPGVHFLDGDELKGFSNFIGFNKDSGPYREIQEYWLFLHENPSSLWLIVRIGKSRYAWLCAGDLKKSYPFNGGQFYGGSRDICHPDSDYLCLSACQVRVKDGEFRSVGNGWGSSLVTGVNTLGTTDQQSYDRIPGIPDYSFRITSPPSSSEQGNPNHPLGKTYIAEQSRGVFHPAYAYVERLPSEGYPPPNLSYNAGFGYSILGTLPHLYLMSTQSFQEIREFSVGRDKYMLFPFGDRGADWICYRVPVPQDPDERIYPHMGIGMVIRVPDDA